MRVYPDFEWTNGYSAELVKMLCPLAFLLRTKPSAQHREWLGQVCRDVISRMDSSGAIRETFGAMDKGMYPPPCSNKEYGTREASLLQKDGDPCCDLFYTQVFGLAGMHEAFIATGEPAYQNATNKMAEFMIRTQISSTTQPEVDGAWMRAFDFDLWEYWGSSADRDWGAWCVESGWTNSAAALAFSLILAGQGLYDLLPADRSYVKHLPALLDELQTIFPVERNAPKAARADLGNED